MLDFESFHHQFSLKLILFKRTTLKLAYPKALSFLHLLDEPTIFFPFLSELLLKLLDILPRTNLIPTFISELIGSFLDFMQQPELFNILLGDARLAEGTFGLLAFSEEGIDALEATAVLREADHHWVFMVVVIGLQANRTVELDALFNKATWAYFHQDNILISCK